MYLIFLLSFHQNLYLYVEIFFKRKRERLNLGMKFYVESSNIKWIGVFFVFFAANMFVGRTGSVSYTHLDVYKRQVLQTVLHITQIKKNSAFMIWKYDIF